MKKNLLSFLMFALSAALLFAGATGESGQEPQVFLS